VLICMYARLISVGHPVSLHDALPIFVADVDAAVPVDLHEAVEGNSVADRDAPSDPCANIDRVLKETIAADADIRGVDDSRAGSEHAARSCDAQNVAEAERREGDAREPERFERISTEVGERFSEPVAP